MAKILKGILLGFIFSISWTTPALAIENPDYIVIGEVAVFESVILSGDVLVYARYDTSYSSQPEEDAEDTFLLAIYDTDGTTLLATRALNYYQHNIISIYLSPEDNSIVTDVAYKVRIMGNPGIFGSLVEDVNMDTRTLSPDDYHGLNDLGGFVTGQAEILEADWELTLLTAGNKLNSTGSYYFLKAIPGLSNMVPTIFEVTTEYYTFTKDNFTEEGLNATLLRHPASLESATDGLNTIFGIFNEDWGEAGWALIGALIVGGVFYATTRRPDMAVLGGSGGSLAIAAYYGMASGNVLLLVMAIGTFIIVLFALEFIVPRLG